MFFLLDVVVGVDVESLFDKIRHHFATTLRHVIKVILKKIKLREMKSYLATVYRELIEGLRNVHSYEELIELLRENFFFTNIRMLEGLAEEYAKGIPKVSKLLTEFKEVRDKLYEQVLAKDFVKEAKERVRTSHAKVLFVCHGSYF